MRSQVPPVCAHCQSVKSPLWRRGANMEVLCNACGLYWKHHNTYRPLALKAAAERKSRMVQTLPSMNSSSSSNSGSGSSDQRHGSSVHPLAYSNPQVTHFNRNGHENNQFGKAGPMLTSNILMAPGNYRPGAGYPPLYPKSGSSDSDSKNMINNNNNPSNSSYLLPPLEYVKTRPASNDYSSVPNMMANQRQLSAAVVLPNLRSVIENLSNENLNSNNVLNRNTILKSASNHQYQNQNQYYNASIMNGQASNSNSVSSNSQVQHARTNPAYHHPQAQQQQAASSVNVPVKFIINRGSTIYQGDHVSIRGSDSQIYFAVVLDFWLTVNGRRYCTLRWLIPKPNHSFSCPLQDRFYLGPIHEKVEVMETILDVFYSPYRDQMTSDTIRKRFILSPSEVKGNESSSYDNNNNSSNNNNNNSNSLKGSKDNLNAVEPPLQLIKAIRSMELASSPSPASPSLPAAQNFENSPNSPSSRLFKSSSTSSSEDDVIMNPIISAESHEIAAKMLLSMN